MKSYLLTVSLSLSETTRLRHVNPLVTRLRPARTTPGRCPQVVREVRPWDPCSVLACRATRRPDFHCTVPEQLLISIFFPDAPTSPSPSGTPMPAPTAASWLPELDGGAEEHVVADALKTTVVIVTVVAAFVADESGPQLAMAFAGNDWKSAALGRAAARVVELQTTPFVLVVIEAESADNAAA
jgi:hypothetical protein